MIIKILFLVVLGIIPFMLKSGDYLYWVLLIVWLALCWLLKITCARSMHFTLVLFLLASFLKLLGLNDITEFVFKLSLISLAIGVGQAVFELSVRD